MSVEGIPWVVAYEVGCFSALYLDYSNEGN